jgi:2-methylcitrate dehydratase PrpD
MSAVESPSATQELAGFVAGLDADALPENVAHQAKRCLIDWLGVTLAGSGHQSAGVLLAVAAEVGAEEQATALGCGRRVSVPFAALINGFLSHVYDYDDTYNPGQTTVHGSAPVWPAVLALSERAPTDGRRALTAFVAGFEAEVRLALGAGPGHYDAGWHVTGTVGHLGAAAAAANLLGLSHAEVVNAFGTAVTQSAGLKAVYGSMGKPLHPGKAAMDGVLSALLARAGFTSSPTALEGKNGFLQVLAPAPEPELVTAGLGERWTLLDDGFKAYACGSLTHPTVDAIISLRNEHGLRPDDVELIEATVHSYVSWVTAKERPATGLEGKFSIFHCAAVALVDGRADLVQFSDERVNAGDIVAVRDRVRIVVDDALAKDAASVTIVLRDGRRLSRSVEHNKGTPGNPMSDDEVAAKFLALAAPAIGEQAAQGVLADCWRLEHVDDVGELARRCAGPER